MARQPSLTRTSPVNRTLAVEHITIRKPPKTFSNPARPTHHEISVLLRVQRPPVAPRGRTLRLDAEPESTLRSPQRAFQAPDPRSVTPSDRAALRSRHLPESQVQLRGLRVRARVLRALRKWSDFFGGYSRREDVPRIATAVFVKSVCGQCEQQDI